MALLLMFGIVQNQIKFILKKIHKLKRGILQYKIMHLMGISLCVVHSLYLDCYKQLNQRLFFN